MILTSSTILIGNIYFSSFSRDMCILFIHANPQPTEGGYRLIVASNRDEQYERPAATLARIDDTIIGGKFIGFLYYHCFERIASEHDTYIQGVFTVFQIYLLLWSSYNCRLSSNIF